jgi:hypothetical protein
VANSEQEYSSAEVETQENSKEPFTGSFRGKRLFKVLLAVVTFLAICAALYWGFGVPRHPKPSLQFRGLGAGLSKAEVSALLSHPGDKLDCKPDQDGGQTCDCKFGNARGTLTFSPKDTVIQFELRLDSTQGKEAVQQIYEDMTAQMGQGQNVELDDGGGLLSWEKQAGKREVMWKTGKTVPCLLDLTKDCSSQELTLMYGPGILNAPPSASIELWDWGYYADSEGLTRPNPNTPHPTVGGKFQLLGLSGGEDISAVFNALGGRFSPPDCHNDEKEITYKCTAAQGASRLELTFFHSQLESFNYHFHAKDWTDTLRSFKASLHSEPTEVDSRTSSDTDSWKSTATAPCIGDPEKKCPVEALILNRNKDDDEGKAIYMYMPLTDAEIKARTFWGIQHPAEPGETVESLDSSQTAVSVKTMTVYAESASTLKQVDFRNRSYHLNGAEVQVKGGAYHYQENGGVEDVHVNDIWFLTEPSDGSQYAVVSLYNVSCGGSCGDEGFLLVFTVANSRLELVQELRFDEQADGAGIRLDVNSRHLTIHARSNDNSPHCCPANLDIADFKWNGHGFAFEKGERIPIKQ